MRFYTRTAIALIIAGALISQTPAIMHADDGSSSSSHNSCFMSRNVNGERWSSSDCNEVRPQMQRDMANITSMMDRLSVPAKPSVAAPPVAEHSNDDDPITAHIMDSISAFIQQLFFRLPWLS
jgi:hypothetical protein